MCVGSTDQGSVTSTSVVREENTWTTLRFETTNSASPFVEDRTQVLLTKVYEGKEGKRKRRIRLPSPCSAPADRRVWCNLSPLAGVYRRITLSHRRRGHPRVTENVRRVGVGWTEPTPLSEGRTVWVGCKGTDDRRRDWHPVDTDPVGSFEEVEGNPLGVEEGTPDLGLNTFPRGGDK